MAVEWNGGYCYVMDYYGILNNFAAFLSLEFGVYFRVLIIFTFQLNIENIHVTVQWLLIWMLLLPLIGFHVTHYNDLYLILALHFYDGIKEN